MGITSIFSISLRGLDVSRAAMETVSHNVANVNTEGYSRQRANLETTMPVVSRVGPLGTGVDITNITRAHDEFLTKNLIFKSSNLAKYESEKLGIDSIEAVFNETFGNGVNDALSEYWNAWQDVANNPEGNPERVNLLEKGDTLAGALNQMRIDLDTIRADINRRIEENIGQANTLIREIADINNTLVTQEAGLNHQANDLRDQREQHLYELSQILEINYFEDPVTGAVTVLTPKGTPLVEESSSWELQAQTADDGDIQINWVRKSGGLVDITDNIDTGTLGGLTELRDDLMDDFYQQFEAFADALITEVNRQHVQGVGLTNFEDVTSTYAISDYAGYRTDIPGDDNDLMFQAMTDGPAGDNIGIKMVKAGSPASQLSATAVYDAVSGRTDITILLPVNSAGQVIATAEEVAELINEDRTTNLAVPAPYPPSGPPYRIGDFIQVTTVRGERGQGIVDGWSDPNAADGFYRLNHDLEHVLPYGDEIVYGFDKARYQTDLNGDNNDLIFEVSQNYLDANPDSFGETINIEYYTGAPAGAYALQVDTPIAGDTIRIRLETDATGAILTTANDIVNYITYSSNADAVAARDYISVTRVQGQTGQGLVTTMGPQYLDRSGSFDLVVYDADGNPDINQIIVRPTHTIEDVINQINDIGNISAGLHQESGRDYLRIQTDAGYEFAFGDDTANALMALGINTFFTGTGTGDIAVNRILEEDVRLIASGRLDELGQSQTGDNENALDMADIKDKKFLINNQNSTISESYNTVASEVGAATHAVTRSHDFNQSLVNNLHQQRDMVAAVNLDEEMADLMKFQYMYQAAAKMISAADEMLQTLLAMK